MIVVYVAPTDVLNSLIVLIAAAGLLALLQMQHYHFQKKLAAQQVTNQSILADEQAQHQLTLQHELRQGYQQQYSAQEGVEEERQAHITQSLPHQTPSSLS